MVVIAMMSVPSPFNGYHEMNRINWNFGIGRQNKVSQSSLKTLVLELIFSVPDTFITKSLKETWDRQS